MKSIGTLENNVETLYNIFKPLCRNPERRDLMPRRKKEKKRNLLLTAKKDEAKRLRFLFL